MNQIVLLAKEGKVRALELNNESHIDELIKNDWQVKKQIVATDWIEKICNGSEIDLQKEFVSIIGSPLPKTDQPLNIYTLGITSADKLKWAFMVVRDGMVIYTDSGDVPDRYRNYGSLGAHMTAAVNGLLWSVEKEKQCHLYVQDSRLMTPVYDLFVKGADTCRLNNSLQKWFRDVVVENLKFVRAVKAMRKDENKWRLHLRNMFKKNKITWKNAV